MEEAVQEKVGVTIRGRREALRLSQEAFADQIGMHRAYYSSLERGERNLTLGTLLRVCEGLQARPSDVLKESGI